MNMTAKMNKWTSLLLASVLTVSLAACGGGNGTSTESNATKETPTEETTTTETKTEEAPVTLKYVSWMSKGEDKPILDEFMKKYPNIKVEDTVLDGQKYDQLLKTKFLAGDGPDVYLFMKSA